MKKKEDQYASPLPRGMTPATMVEEVDTGDHIPDTIAKEIGDALRANQGEWYELNEEIQKDLLFGENANFGYLPEDAPGQVAARLNRSDPCLNLFKCQRSLDGKSVAVMYDNDPRDYRLRCVTVEAHQPKR